MTAEAHPVDQVPDRAAQDQGEGRLEKPLPRRRARPRRGLATKTTRATASGGGRSGDVAPAKRPKAAPVFRSG